MRQQSVRFRNRESAQNRLALGFASSSDMGNIDAAVDQRDCCSLSMITLRGSVRRGASDLMLVLIYIFWQMVALLMLKVRALFKEEWPWKSDWTWSQGLFQGAAFAGIWAIIYFVMLSVQVS